MEKSCRKSTGVATVAAQDEEAELQRFARLLRKAFPGAASDHELSETAAAVLSTRRRNVHPKTVRNWLNGDNTPHFRHVMRVLAIAGAEGVFGLLDPEDRA
ncbi:MULTISPECIES: hypothetical protein [Haematobacter]|uniref:hypothetical protein n=1 Tax=Haematobacter TaxID=366614 RepID=UPI001F622BB2|nr:MULTISPECIES: hypothetical protein [Haematobacter]